MGGKGGTQITVPGINLSVQFPAIKASGVVAYRRARLAQLSPNSTVICIQPVGDWHKPEGVIIVGVAVARGVGEGVNVGSPGF